MLFIQNAPDFETGKLVQSIAPIDRDFLARNVIILLVLLNCNFFNFKICRFFRACGFQFSTLWWFVWFTQRTVSNRHIVRGLDSVKFRVLVFFRLIFKIDFRIRKFRVENAVFIFLFLSFRRFYNWNLLSRARFLFGNLLIGLITLIHFKILPFSKPQYWLWCKV